MPCGTAAFDPFGVVQEAPADLPLFYAGRLVDREAQLVHMRARFYAPELGQFLTPDPSLLEGGENVVDVSGGEEQQSSTVHAEPLRPQLHLGCRLLARHVQHCPRFGRSVGREPQQQSRLADARIARD